MKKILLLTLLFVFIFSSICQADFTTEVGAKYSSIRNQINWITGAKYEKNDMTIGFRLNNWTTKPIKSNTPPYIGFAPMSTKYTWYLEYDATDKLKIKTERFCEHWTMQSREYNDYVGYNISVMYEF